MNCGRCSGGSEDADRRRLCWDCTKKLSSALGRVPWLAEELQIQITRQAKGAPSVGRPGGEVPLAFDDDASEASWVLATVLNVWSKEVPSPYTPPREYSTTGLAVWLQHHTLALAALIDAGDCAIEINDAVTQATRAIDRHPPALFLGQCACGRALYLRSDSEWVDCACGRSHDAQAMREQNRAHGRQWMVTAREASRLLGEVYGKPISTAGIRQWVRRGKLAATVTDPSTREDLFLLGDLLRCQEGL